MKLITVILPYILISPVSVAVFFIALFLSCLSIEYIMHGILYILGILSSISQDWQNMFVAASGAGISLIAAALFMNKAVREMQQQLHMKSNS